MCAYKKKNGSSLKNGKKTTDNPSTTKTRNMGLPMTLFVNAKDDKCPYKTI